LKGEKRGDLPVLIPIHNAREDIVRVGARADQEEDDEEKGLEVEESGLRAQIGGLVCWVEERMRKGGGDMTIATPCPSPFLS
jgi:hypothetical protein